MTRMHVPSLDRRIVQPRAWNRKLWGVAYMSASGRPILIGTLWDNGPRNVPGPEPTRALLFCSREQARAWCRSKNQRNRFGQFRPIRVRETVRKV